MATEFETMSDASTFRRMAAAMWRRPQDPTIHGTMDLDATPALAMIERWRVRTGRKVTMTHIVCHAVAQAFAKHPQLNAKVRLWGKLERRKSVDLFVSVVTDEGRDLSGARIDNADKLTVSDFATAIGKLAGGIRKGEDKDFERSRGLFHRLPWWVVRPILWLADVATNELHLHLPSLGMPRDAFGTAVVTNVGMFGIDTAYAPFLPLGRCPLLVVISEVRDRPWVADGKLEVRKVLRLCATIDHRIIDGFAASLLAREVIACIENPRMEAYGPVPEAVEEVQPVAATG